MTDEAQDSPQWVQSRIKGVKAKPDCGGTHSACKCFIEKIIKLEEEVARLKRYRSYE